MLDGPVCWAGVYIGSFDAMGKALNHYLNHYTKGDEKR